MSAQRITGLEGNGAFLVREVALARRIQRGLERLYHLESAANVDDFVAEASDGDREGLIVKQSSGGLELRLHLPKLGTDTADLDGICQIIEGVSHFVYVADRASYDRSITQLELELQAEVDKYVVLAASQERFDPAASRELRERLYERVAYVHAPDTIEGERYRLANDRAYRFTGHLERTFVAPKRYGELRDELRRFFHMSQGEKLRAA